MRWFAVLFLGLASLSHATEARACSCMQLTASEGLTSSSFVFTGEVLEIAKNEATRFGGLEVTLRVKRLWKGNPVETLKVHTAGSSAACGYSFVKGQTYLVYAVSDEADPLRVSLCSRTAPVDQAKEDLDYLGKPEHDFDRGSARRKNRNCSASPIGEAPNDAAWMLLVLTGLALSARRLV